MSKLKIGTKVHYQQGDSGWLKGEITGTGEKNGMKVYDVELDKPYNGGTSYWGYANQFVIR